MKLKRYLFIGVLLLLPAMACNAGNIGNTINGSGIITTQTYAVKDFTGVILEGVGDVYITQENTESLSIETDDNLFAQLNIRVSGDDLILGSQPYVNLNPSKSIIYRLAVKDLSDMTLAGSGNIYSEPLQATSLKVTVAGSGDVEVKGLTGTDLSVNLTGSGNITFDQIAVTSIDISIDGSGDIKLNGKVDIQTIEVYGSGKYLAGDLETANADILIQGSCNLTVWVKDKLDIHVNGSGDVSYYGRPTTNQSGNGSGNVLSLGEK